MTLDTHVKAFLDVLAAANRPKVWEVTPAEARNMALAFAEIVEAKGVPIGKVENGTLPGPAGAISFRVYTPVASAGQLAGIVYFHGGGWVFCNLDTHDAMCRTLANESGCRIVSIDYRLAPEHKFPAAVDDAYAATQWVAAHASELGIDRDRLAVAGDSAGGNLAAVVCQLAKSSGPKIALEVLFCPATDVTADTQSRREFAEGYLLEERAMQWLVAQYLPTDSDPRDTRISPLQAADFSGLPPAHIHTAAFDPLRDSGKAYADALERAGVKVNYTCHEGMIHHFYAMAAVIPYANTAMKSAGAAIKTALARPVKSSAA
jgi:acetyl esterase